MAIWTWADPRLWPEEQGEKEIPGGREAISQPSSELVHIPSISSLFLCSSSYRCGSHLLFGGRANRCFANPPWRGKIIPTRQRLNKVKEWLGLCGTGKTIVAGEKPQHRAPAWSIPCLWWRQAGWLGWLEMATSLLRKTGNSHLPRNPPDKDFCLACLLSPLLSKLLDAVE